ncbi:PLP-dependent aminotransferase family protein [Hansschlegelia sp.]|uniref:aminotransferase-like domain-containing protein n=1 Tax=Hansschlegelia sp. TaxID=2041892 RepID=UPI002CCD3A83|nr:PLP-dependent aminotransferase family protein [Hansschlegelia sp.]HVI27942.1 PLP-dependent aminotransferase family protein [Hansschlegelia sp.]
MAPLWRPQIHGAAGPLYVQIADQIEAAVAAGELRAGDRLPPQRALADELGVDLTTVTRAYAEARRRNLLDAVTGRGSFVAAPRKAAGPAIDLTMNVPPSPRGVRLAEEIGRGVRDLLARSDVDTLMSYHAGPGAPGDRACAAAWLRQTLGAVDPERICISPGAQPALAALLAMHGRADGVVLTEPLTYPGLLSAAGHLRLRTAAVAADQDGMRPDALAAAASESGGRLVYLNPTICNPTAATMPEARRREIVAVAARARLTIIEDDPYAPLAGDAPPAFAALAPSLTWHVATVSKCLAPGFRTAFVVAPGGAEAGSVARALRALTLMPAPLMVSLLSFWIRDGVAADVLAGVRAEAAARQTLAQDILPAEARAHPSGLHVWLPLPSRWNRHGLIESARAQGLGVTPSDAFAAGADAPEAVRISLGGVPERARLAGALRTLAAVVADAEGAAHEVV